VLIAWMNKHKVRLKVCHGDESVQLSAGDIQDAERMIAMLKGEAARRPDDGD
jgi:hypothetical protein